MAGIMKRAFIHVLLKALGNREVVNKINEICSLSHVDTGELVDFPVPYFGHTCVADEPQTPAPVFITSRFRSGSTLLWNIFRNIERCTAYYEPLNERRWFERASRGENVDRTHIGVDDYWSEYDGMDDLGTFYKETWVKSELFMDSRSWNPDMRAYIHQLIVRSQGTAVLQFNRVDFRLPWLKQNFPSAKIVHLYRNPRDQWLSFLKDQSLMNKDDVLSTYTDAFYLDPWCNDLQKLFPFLSTKETPHPYQRFYYIWRLSYIYGKIHADISMSFEDLVSTPELALGRMFEILEWEGVEREPLVQIIKKPGLNRWKGYANAEWFLDHELACDEQLSRFIGAR